MDDRRSSFHINDYNELELLAALHALKAFKKNSVGISIRLMLDNATAVHYINKSGGSRSKSLNNIMSSIVGWCEQRNLSIHAIHLPGALNFIADRLFRTALDSSDWKLRAAVFESLRSGFIRKQLEQAAEQFCQFRPIGAGAPSSELSRTSHMAVIRENYESTSVSNQVVELTFGRNS